METPGFNAFALAHEPWTFTDRSGKVHVARDISAPQAARFVILLQLANGDVSKHERIVSQLVRQLFPWKLKYWWTGDPYGRFMRLTPRQRAEALQSFFDQAGWGIRLHLPSPPTLKPPSSRNSGASTRTPTRPRAATPAP